MPVMRMEDRIGIPMNVDKLHPKLSHSTGHARPEILDTVKGRPESDALTPTQPRGPETESLMGVKGAWYDVQAVEPAHGYHGYEN